MIEDTSGNRREWYDEPVPEPRELHHGIVRMQLISSRQAGKIDAMSQLEQAMKDISKIMHKNMHDLFKTMKKSDYTLFPPGQEMESVKDRALRLGQQPHSMAQDPSDFHFDLRGRKRY